MEYAKLDFKTDLFPGFPDVPAGAPRWVDWSSNSTGSINNAEYFRRKSTSASGHSEPQFISDITSLWIANHGAIVDALTPPTGSTQVYFTAIQLFGTNDSCDGCLTQLFDYRKTIQAGQQSLAKAIRDKCTSRGIGLPGETHLNGVLIYNAAIPYKPLGAASMTYRFKLNGSTRNLGYSYVFTTDYESTSPKMRGTFSVEGETLPDTHTYELAQHSSREIEKDIVYGHITELPVVDYKPTENKFVTAEIALRP